MEIYWVIDGRRCGPATVPDIISRVRLGELSPETKGWHAGCPAWAPLRELPALADFLQEKSPEPSADEDEALPPVPPAAPAEAQKSEETAAEEQPESTQRVWLPSAAARLLARMVDIGLYLGLVYTAIYVQQLPYAENLLPMAPFIWLGFIAAEAALLSFFGTTPGKAFFHIRVIAFSEGAAEPLGLLRSLGRACMVFVGGMGMMCSFLPVVMCGFSWWMLRKHGITYWDARMCTFPAQSRPAGLLRYLLAPVLIFFCLNVVGVCLEPWLPAMVDDIAAQSPETAERLKQWMPQLPAAQPTAGQLNEQR